MALAIPASGLAKVTAPSQLQITYVGSSSFRLAVNGNAVAAGGSIPADTYEVLVVDPDDQSPHFQLSGPGVNIDSSLNSTGMGIDMPAMFGPYTLSANGSYTAHDVTSGASISFSTTAGGSSGSSSGGSSGVVGTGALSSGSSASSSSSSASSTSKSTVGTLTGSISAAAKAALSFHGRSVKRLKAGVYTLKVADHSKQAGFVVQKLGFHAMSESSKLFVGSHSKRLTLSAGRWFFEASPGGAKTSFTVAQ